jgi:ornithine carbamoyltransferase
MSAITTTTTPSDLLRIADLTAAQLTALLDLADEMKNGPTWWTGTRDGTTVACRFDTPAAHARASFEAALRRLGMLPMLLGPHELPLDDVKRLAEAARMLSTYAGAIVVRTSAHAAVEALAEVASIPVVNARTDAHQPCQALADLLTVRRHFGYLEGIRLAYVGDGGNVAHSLMEAGALAGMHVAVATPVGCGPDHDLTLGALALAAAHGGSIQLGHDPRDAVANADVVYSGAWASMGADFEGYRVDDALMRADFERYRVDDALMRRAAPGAVFMRCLPARRGVEVTAEILDGASSLVAEQAANRLPTVQATLHTLVREES